MVLFVRTGDNWNNLIEQTCLNSSIPETEFTVLSFESPHIMSGKAQTWRG